MVLIMTLLLPAHAFADAKSNKKIAINYTLNYCINYDYKIVSYKHVPKNRQGIVYIEKIRTKSLGCKKGVTRDNKIVKYCKSIKRGKIEVVYLVYNPQNNCSDDVIAFVSNNTIKADYITLYNNVNCINCNGTSCDCVYYLHDENRHMTEEEINDLEYWEEHYINENGETIER